MKSMTSRTDLPTLAEILDSRERRAARLMAWDAQGGGAVVSLTVNWPGPDKGCAMANAIHRAGVEALEEAFGDRILRREMEALPTGGEGTFLIAGTPGEVKGITVGIEDAHMLGRLFDMDVIQDGQPLSRGQLGHAPRRCLICGGETLVCRRQKQHTLEELLICIEAMTAAHEAQR